MSKKKIFYFLIVAVSFIILGSLVSASIFGNIFLKSTNKIVYNIKNNYSSNSSCFDSDRGIIPEIMGFTTFYLNGFSNEANDYCLNSSYLREFYCGKIPGFPYGYSQIDIYCPKGCVDRACSNYTQHNCTDTDNGINIYLKGQTYADGILYFTEKCISNVVLYESYCGVGGSVHGKWINCPVNSKCIDGACFNYTGNSTQATCNDTDGGLNYFVKGTVFGNYINSTNFSFTDFCISNSSVLNEYYCNETFPVAKIFNCKISCFNGACL